VSPEERRDQIAAVVNRVLVRVLTDDAWAGEASDRVAVQDYGELSRAQGDLVAWADAVWLGSILLERAGDLRGAEREVASLQANQDVARRQVADLRPRARVTGKYRYLPARLAALRYRLEDDASALFDAVEWAKSRALSDAAGDETPPRFDTLQKALAGTRTHYLTFLLDTTESFAVLVTADGTARVARIPVGRAQAKDYATPEKIRPDGRAGPTANPLLPRGDWSLQLAPLAAPLDAAYAERRIVERDTLLISPHSLLHLFPLHELALPSAGGRSIGEVAAVVRVHGAATVLRCLAAGSPSRPNRAIVLRAPLEQELADDAYAAAFERCAALLGARLGRPPVCVDKEYATVQAVLAELGPERMLHLACHGDMLTSGPAEDRSFLLLAPGTGLPERKPRGGGLPLGTLTPSLVLKRAAEMSNGDPAPLRGMHVTLQACVSGHAAANPQGDAIGLEWAFLMAGAASTLGTHWHVDREDAAAFAQTFYASWLGGAGRAEAWAAAGAALRGMHDDSRWAAFSLTGEWR
jgi:hypothetical protein